MYNYYTTQKAYLETLWDLFLGSTKGFKTKW